MSSSLAVQPAISKRDVRSRARGSAAAQARDALKRNMIKLTMRRRCTRCSATYSEIDNLGAWKCLFHPGDVESEHFHIAGIESGHWTCCARSTGSTRPLDNRQYPSGEPYTHTRALGCTRCDHVSSITRAHEPTRTLNREQANRLLGDDALRTEPGRIVDEQTGEMVIVRHGADSV